MKPIIQFHKALCRSCMKCIRSCPTEALSIIDNTVVIDDDRCIRCDACIKSCSNRSLYTEGAELATLQEFDYTAILIPTAILSDVSGKDEIETLWSAIERIGFDEVVDISDITGAIYQRAQQSLNESDGKLMIHSICPAVNRLIEVKYPMLMQSLLPMDYPVEVAARRIRKRLADSKGKVGIYSLCECAAKLSLAKHPYGNEASAIDYALTISDLFPHINRLKDNSRRSCSFCKEGILAVVHDFYDTGMEKRDVLAVDGLDKVEDVLELAEFENLKSIRLLSLYACANGCIGGRFLWGNPYVGRIFVERFLHDATKPPAVCSDEELLRQSTVLPKTTQLDMKDKVRQFMEVNKQLERLPGYDCGACGFASCRIMAQKIVNHEATIRDCKIWKGRGDAE